MVSIKWTNEALANLREIKQYIAHDSVYYAQRTVHYIIESCKLLHKHPEAGRAIMKQDGFVLRRINVKSYMVVYTYHQDEVFIVAIVHQAKQPPTYFNISEITE